MKLTAYVIDFLVRQGIRHVFGLTGGAAVHLFDSADKNPDIKPVFCHHEQAAALAAVTYARVRNGFGAAIVTTGPGGTNAITGVTSAWQDSIPCFFISGQSRIEHTTHGKPLRQLAPQELDIVSIVKPITKYAVMVEDPSTIRYHLEKAAFLAKDSRPGPVWIDIPQDFQWTTIEPYTLKGFDTSSIEQHNPLSQSIAKWCRQCYDLLVEARRPLFLSGYGIRLSHAEKDFVNLIETLKIPFVSTYTVSDIVPTNHVLYAGRLGMSGQRGANLSVQNCDLLIAIGSHLSIPLTGSRFDFFARDAKIIMVDIDKEEFGFETVRVDLPICCDAKIFIDEFIGQTPHAKLDAPVWWHKKCLKYKSYNKIPEEWSKQEEHVNPYVFVDILSDELNNDDIIIIDGSGTVFYTGFQAVRVKEGQRLISSTGIAAMGTGLPESIGACFVSKGQRTVSLCGDGSMQLNIQELQTIFHHDLNIKIFVFNNGGYLAIQHTQDEFLEGKHVGSDASGGLSLPDLQKVSEAYGIRAIRINNHQELLERLRWTLNQTGPVLCEIMISRDQQVIPRQGFDRNPDGTYSPRPLEDMYPYLDRKEFLENMIVAPLDVSIKD